ncbi:hypothetical protein AKJ16_DCAP24517 [Drosera capensis]
MISSTMRGCERGFSRRRTREKLLNNPTVVLCSPPLPLSPPLPTTIAPPTSTSPGQLSLRTTHLISIQHLNAVLPEGLLHGMQKEFDDSLHTALLVRKSFLDLRDNFRRIVDPPMWPPTTHKDRNYNNWFTFSKYQEPETVALTGQLRELTTVNQFRSMMHNDMMIGAFSHSTAVGKLRKKLPEVPLDARIDAKCCWMEVFSEEKWKKIFSLQWKWCRNEMASSVNIVMLLIRKIRSVSSPISETNPSLESCVIFGSQIYDQQQRV